MCFMQKHSSFEILWFSVSIFQNVFLTMTESYSCNQKHQPYPAVPCGGVTSSRVCRGYFKKSFDFFFRISPASVRPVGPRVFLMRCLGQDVVLSRAAVCWSRGAVLLRGRRVPLLICAGWQCGTGAIFLLCFQASFSLFYFW